MIRARPVKSKIKGLTLLEVLIALIILSIGVLGIATMQLRSLQFSQSAYERSIAVIQANDAIERLWAGACELYQGPENNRSANTQTVNQIVGAWRSDSSGLVGEQEEWVGTIIGQDDNGSTTFLIDISWDDRHNNNVEHSFSYQVKIPDLRCDS